jgi:hypothetical protein
MRVGCWHIEFVRLVLEMPALSALDTHPHDYRDVVVHADSVMAPAVCVTTNFVRNRGETLSPLTSFA